MDNQNTSPSAANAAILVGILLALAGTGWLLHLATRTHTVTREATLQATPTAEPTAIPTAEPALVEPAPGESAAPSVVPEPAAPTAERAAPTAPTEQTGEPTDRGLTNAGLSFLVDTDLGSGSVEFSAVTLNEASNRLMIADDEGRLFEFDLAADGTPAVPPRRTLRVTAGAGDLEGIAWMIDTTYVLAHEDDGRLTVVVIDEDATAVTPEAVVRTIDTGIREIDGNGLEGVSYLGWTDGAIEFVVVDERPATLYFLTTDGTVASTVELDLPDVSDVWASSETMLSVVSDEGRSVVRLRVAEDDTVEVLEQLSLTLSDGRFEQPEGLVRDRAGTRRYVVGELPGPSRYSFGLWTAVATTDG